MTDSRLDSYLVKHGFFASREQAKRAIEEGRVSIDGRTAGKPAQAVAESARVEVAEPAAAFVSRGGFKLAKALTVFGIRLDGLVCADVGASTGGFTDCMLQSGAAGVTAFDVGHGQMAEKLRADPRVVNREDVNFRYFDARAEGFESRFDFAAMDVSFISVSLMLAPLKACLKPDSGNAVVLIKPQFEAGRAALNKAGVVTDPKVHETVLRAFRASAAAAGFTLMGLTWSPVREKGGNIEYLAHISAAAPQTAAAENTEHLTVVEAFRNLW